MEIKLNKEDNRSFILKSESLVKPQDVTTISFLGDFNKMLPRKTQHNLMRRGSKKIPYMGFIVEPYCLFLSYRIKNTETARTMLPDGYELAEASIFKNGQKYPMVIISAFSVRTSAFIGMRLEFYIIARSSDTGLLSWIIADYETNTNSHDPKNGFCGYSSNPSVFTITPYGELLVDVKGSKNQNEFSLSAQLQKGKMEELDATLWIEGNLSIEYGGALKNDVSKPFSLIFDPILMKEALNIPTENISIKANSYLRNIIDYNKPESAAVFPYSQHFIIKQDLKKGELIDEAGLNHQIKAFLARKSFKTMSGNDIKKPLYSGILVSALVNFGFMLFLLLKLLL